jgi:hypothetical protein
MDLRPSFGHDHARMLPETLIHRVVGSIGPGLRFALVSPGARILKRGGFDIGVFHCRLLSKLK